jgi:hypothetical protein
LIKLQHGNLLDILDLDRFTKCILALVPKSAQAAICQQMIFTYIHQEKLILQELQASQGVEGGVDILR